MVKSGVRVKVRVMKSEVVVRPFTKLENDIQLQCRLLRFARKLTESCRCRLCRGYGRCETFAVSLAITISVDNSSFGGDQYFEVFLFSKLWIVKGKDKEKDRGYHQRRFEIYPHTHLFPYPLG